MDFLLELLLSGCEVITVNFPIGEDEEYKDEPDKILKNIGAEEVEDSGSDCNMLLGIFGQ